MPTIEEIRNNALALLPPEYQAQIAEQERKKQQFNERFGPVGGALYNLGRGATHSAINSLYGMATLPFAATNAVGLTDFDFARQGLVGPHSLTGGDDPTASGAAYNIGSLGGFIGTLLAGGAGAGKLASKLVRSSDDAAAALRAASAGATVAERARAFRALPAKVKAAQLALAPEQAALGVGFGVPGNLVAKAARGATEFGMFGALRTPGSLETRLDMGLHEAPVGAIFGLATRTRGIRLTDGRMLVGREAEKFLTRNTESGHWAEALRKGLLDRANPIEPLLPRKIPGKTRLTPGFITSSASRGFGAGLLTPGMSPMEFTGQPNIDSAIFNSIFFGGLSLQHRTPQVPGRIEALRVKKDNAERALRDVPTKQGELPLDFEGVERRPQEPTQGNLFTAEELNAPLGKPTVRRNSRGQFERLDPFLEADARGKTKQGELPFGEEPPFPPRQAESDPSLYPHFYDQHPIFGPVLKYQKGQEIATRDGVVGTVEALDMANDSIIIRTSKGERAAVTPQEVLKDGTPVPSRARFSAIDDFALVLREDVARIPGEGLSSAGDVPLSERKNRSISKIGRLVGKFYDDLLEKPLGLAEDILARYAGTSPERGSADLKAFSMVRAEDFLRKILTDGSEGLKRFASDILRDDMRQLSRGEFYPGIDAVVFTSDPGSPVSLHLLSDSQGRIHRTLRIGPNYFASPRATRISDLRHELAHSRVFGNTNVLEVLEHGSAQVSNLFNTLGIPSVKLEGNPVDPKTYLLLHERLLRRWVEVHFGDRLPQKNMRYDPQKRTLYLNAGTGFPDSVTGEAVVASHAFLTGPARKSLSKKQRDRIDQYWYLETPMVGTDPFVIKGGGSVETSSRRILGDYYAYSSPHEMISRLLEESAGFLSPERAAKVMGSDAVQLLKLFWGDPRALADRRSFAARRGTRDPRQGELFGEPKFGPENEPSIHFLLAPSYVDAIQKGTITAGFASSKKADPPPFLMRFMQDMAYFDEQLSSKGKVSEGVLKKWGMFELLTVKLSPDEIGSIVSEVTSKHLGMLAEGKEQPFKAAVRKEVADLVEANKALAGGVDPTKAGDSTQGRGVTGQARKNQPIDKVDPADVIEAVTGEGTTGRAEAGGKKGKRKAGKRKRDPAPYKVHYLDETGTAREVIITPGDERSLSNQPGVRFTRLPHQRANLLRGLSQLFANGFEGLRKNTSLTSQEKKILQMAYGGLKVQFPDGSRGHLFTNPDGSPIYDGSPTIAEIAGRLGVSTRTVTKTISRFIDGVGRKPKVEFFEGMGMPQLNRTSTYAIIKDSRIPIRVRDKPARFGDLDLFYDPQSGQWVYADIPTKDVNRGRISRPANPKRAITYTGQDGKTRTVEVKDEPKRVGIPERIEARSQIDNSKVHLTHLVRDAETKRGIIMGDVEYMAPDGSTLARQAGLFESKGFLEDFVGRERRAGAESNEGQGGRGNTASGDESAAQSAAFEATQLGFERFAPRSGFSTKARKSPLFKPSTTFEREAALFESAKEKVGKPGMTRQEAALLPLSQLLRHVILRLGNTASDRRRGGKRKSEYQAKLEKYFLKGGFLKDKYPETQQMVADFVQGRITRSQVHQEILNAAELAFLTVDPNIRPIKGRKGLRLIEQDTGVVVDVADLATARLLVELKKQRNELAPDLLPRDIDILGVRIEGLESGPLAGGSGWGGGGSRAGDAEAGGGVAPHMWSGGALDARIKMVALRSMRDLAATFSRAVGDPHVFDVVDRLIRGNQVVRNRTAASVDKMISLMKEHKIRKSRHVALARAAEKLSFEIQEIQAIGGKEAALRWARENARESLELSGLSPNEAAFILDQRVRDLWDRGHRRYSVPEDRILMGYFPFYRRRPPQQPGVRSSDLPEPGDFWARYERGDLLEVAPETNVGYLEVFESYTRSGEKHVELGTSPGSAQPSLWEQMRSVVDKYEAHPDSYFLRLTYERSLGIVDEGIVKAQQAHRDRIIRYHARVGQTIKFVDHYQNFATSAVSKVLKAHYDRVGVKLEQAHIETLADIFVTLNRARTFGLHVMRSVRHVTQSSFFVLPRVGPVYFARAIRDLTDPVKAHQIAARAAARGVLKDPFPDQMGEIMRSSHLRSIDKLSAIYGKLDAWERMLSFHAQRLRSIDAVRKYRKSGNLNDYTELSNLEMLHPAFKEAVLGEMRRGNYSRAIDRHAALLVDHAIFDYSRLNAPQWAGSIWGKVFGQYGRWPLGALETMSGLVRFGTTSQKASALALYAGAAAGVYGAGQFLGVHTKEWIPFLHSLGYSGGPGLSIFMDAHEILAGNPFAQDEFMHNWAKDPVATMVSMPVRYLVPLGDVLEGLAAETNLSRRQRRLFGVPRQSINNHELVARLLGFRPLSDSTAHEKLIVMPFAHMFEGPAEGISHLAVEARKALGKR